VGIAGQVLQSAAEQPHFKTLEMTDIPGAAYKVNVLLRQQIHTLSGFDNRRYCSVANDRVLVKDQTASQNGIYIGLQEDQ
jgi:hypothetical protein